MIYINSFGDKLTKNSNVCNMMAIIKNALITVFFLFCTDSILSTSSSCLPLNRGNEFHFIEVFVLLDSPAKAQFIPKTSSCEKYIII